MGTNRTTDAKDTTDPQDFVILNGHRIPILGSVGDGGRITWYGKQPPFKKLSEFDNPKSEIV